MSRVRALLSRVPPPLLFAAFLLLGISLDRRSPLPVTSGALVEVRTIVGWSLVALGGFLAVSSLALFAGRRTTIIPHHRARSLVTSGPFRLSRNPMYVALSCLYVGISVLADTAWPLVFAALPIAFLQVVTIPIEERTLATVFGSEYRDYASRVPRWL
jgi:protein-S-isoprenylcysteine O-methyltransferase Ste14